MENATKALMIAGEVLVGVLIIGVLVAVFTKGGKVTSEYNSGIDAQELAQFNAEYEAFDRDNVTFDEIISLANMAYDYNVQNGNNGNNSITIILVTEGVKYEVNYNTKKGVFNTDGGDVSFYDNVFAEERNSKFKYECTGCDYNEKTGKISLMEFGPVCDHEWETKTLDEAGCVTKGRAYKECRICHEKQDEYDTDPKGHNYEDQPESTSIVQATAENIKKYKFKGSADDETQHLKITDNKKICSRCGDTNEETKITAENHKLNIENGKENFLQATPENLKKYGKSSIKIEKYHLSIVPSKKSCSCGYENKDPNVSVTEHSFGEKTESTNSVPATPENIKKYKFKGSADEKKQHLNITDKTEECDNCGYKNEDRNITAENHKLNTSNEKNTFLQATEENQKKYGKSGIDETVSHLSIATSDKTCTDCNYTYEDLNVSVIEHDYGDPKKTVRIEQATAENQKKYGKSGIDEKTSHLKIEDTEKTCKGCGYKCKTQNVSVIAHTYGTGDNTTTVKQATEENQKKYGKSGIDEAVSHLSIATSIKTCTDCGYINNDQNVSVINHNYGEEEKTVRSEQATEENQKKYGKSGIDKEKDHFRITKIKKTCKDCGYIYNKETVNVAVHNYGAKNENTTILQATEENQKKYGKSGINVEKSHLIINEVEKTCQECNYYYYKNTVEVEEHSFASAGYGTNIKSGTKNVCHFQRALDQCSNCKYLKTLDKSQNKNYGHTYETRTIGIQKLDGTYEDYHGIALYNTENQLVGCQYIGFVYKKCACSCGCNYKTDLEMNSGDHDWVETSREYKFDSFALIKKIWDTSDADRKTITIFGIEVPAETQLEAFIRNIRKIINKTIDIAEYLTGIRVGTAEYKCKKCGETKTEPLAFNQHIADIIEMIEEKIINPALEFIENFNNNLIENLRNMLGEVF